MSWPVAAPSFDRVTPQPKQRTEHKPQEVATSNSPSRSTSAGSSRSPVSSMLLLATRPQLADYDHPKLLLPPGLDKQPSTGSYVAPPPGLKLYTEGTCSYPASYTDTVPAWATSSDVASAPDLPPWPFMLTSTPEALFRSSLRAQGDSVLQQMWSFGDQNLYQVPYPEYEYCEQTQTATPPLPTLLDSVLPCSTTRDKHVSTPPEPVVEGRAPFLRSPVAPGPVSPESHLPEAVEDELLTVGSKLHGVGKCKPCAFLYTKGCENGKECVFCHLCEHGEKKRRKKDRLAKNRLGKWSK